jgi:hypothetical protein
VEKDNSTVPPRRNVSQDEPPVTQRCVTIMMSVNEKNHVSVVTVSMVQLKLIQPRKQTTKINVVSSEASKQCVAMISQPITSQELVASHHKSGIRMLILARSVPTLKHHLNSKHESTSRILVVSVILLMVAKHTSSIGLRKHRAHQL